MTRSSTNSHRTEAKRKPKAERRAELLDTAIQVFYEKGYDASSLQEIADRLGILKGSLYYYFQSKDDLLFAVVSAVHEEGLEVITKAGEVEGDPLERLYQVVTAHVLHTCRNLPKVSVFLHELDSMPAERRNQIIGSGHAYQSVFRDLISSGQQSGQIRDYIDPKVATLSVLGSINWVYRWYRPGGSLSPTQVARQLADMNIASLATPEALAARL